MTTSEQAAEAAIKVFNLQDATPEKALLHAATSGFENEDPDTLLSFKIYSDKIAIIISTGQKYEYTYNDLLKNLWNRLKQPDPKGFPQPLGSKPKAPKATRP